MGKLVRKVEDLDSLRFMMELLREIREKESSIDMEIKPIMEMYQLLECYLPTGFMDKEEIDQKTVLRSNWRKLVQKALSRSNELSRTQIGFKIGLMKDIAAFKSDVSQVSYVTVVFQIFKSRCFVSTQPLYKILFLSFILTLRKMVP